MVTATGAIAQSSSQSSGYGVPILVSLALHAVLLVVVVWGWETSLPKSQTAPRYVEAKLITLKPKAAKPAAPKKTINLAEKRRQQALREQQQRAQREKQKQKIAAAQKRKRAEELARQKKLAAEKAAKEKAAAEAQRQQQLAAERAERERQLAEQQRAEQQRLQQQALADALAQEEAMLQAESDAQQAQSYIGMIAALVEQNWSRPPSARKGMVCELSIQLIPTGEVVSVSVIKSSGSAAFDRSAEQAVKKVGRFEALRDVPPHIFDRYFRQLRLKFNPQDLRL